MILLQSKIEFTEKKLLDHSYSMGNVEGFLTVGGLVGLSSYGDIANCYSTSNTSAEYTVGGLVGGNSGSISNCGSSGEVSGRENVGGLAGTSSGNISMSCSSSSVCAEESVGGLVGHNNNGISSCYASGVVLGNSCVGGLIGYNDRGIVFQCYSMGHVSGNENVGGLLGYYDNGLVLGSFWDTEASGQSTSDGGLRRTTAQMQTATTFIGWGSDGAWTLDNGKDYPRLAWEDKPGEIITTTLSNIMPGSGKPDDPYLVSTAEQMIAIGVDLYEWDKHFQLGADIDLSGYDGEDFDLIGVSTSFPFSGVFDGKGHVIVDFNYAATEKYYVGFFGCVNDPNSEIKNLGLVNPHVTGPDSREVGSLAGLLRKGMISSCWVDGGSVSGDRYVGGLVGGNYETISQSYSDGDAEATGDECGGLVGRNMGSISDCYSLASASAADAVGGLVGLNWTGTISNSYSTGSVTGNTVVGGLAGANVSSVILNCYAEGSVWAANKGGGLIGSNASEILNCYSVGNVSGEDHVGGLVGYSYFDSGLVTNSFWDVNNSGQMSSCGGRGKTRAQMQMASTYVGWGCERMWTIDDGNDYPRLRWEKKPGEIIPNPNYVGGSGKANDPLSPGKTTSPLSTS